MIVRPGRVSVEGDVEMAVGRVVDIVGVGFVRDGSSDAGTISTTSVRIATRVHRRWRVY